MKDGDKILKPKEYNPFENPEEHFSKRMLFSFLLINLNAIELQKKRIEENEVYSDKEVVIKRSMVEYAIQSEVLYIDTHFFLVTVSNFLKVFLRLRQKISDDADFVALYKKYLKELERLDTFRDNQEHITDGRIEGYDKKGKPLKDPHMMGAFQGNDYNFGGEKFNYQDSFELVKNIKKDLQPWIDEWGADPLKSIIRKPEDLSSV